jgi:hypothetical protein
MEKYPTHQLTVPVEFGRKDGGKPKYPRKSRFWPKAVNAIVREARKRRATGFVTLPIPPQGIEDGWYLRRGSMTVRCLIAFLAFPQDGMPRFVGRCDLAWIDKTRRVKI